MSAKTEAVLAAAAEIAKEQDTGDRLTPTETAQAVVDKATAK